MIYPWQEKQWRQISKAYEQDQLAHALLLKGIQGLGQLEFAQELVSLVLCQKNCRNTNVSGKAFAFCQSCHLLKVGNHPDFSVITPEEKSTAIKVQQVRELSDSLTQSPQISDYKAVIIYPAHLMNRNAANALLKTLEEPPGKTLMILISDQPGLLPATILSRTQAIEFYSDSSTLTWLEEKIADQAQAKQLWLSADKSPLMALELSQKHYLNLRDELLKALLSIHANQSSPISSVPMLLKKDIHLLLKAFYSIAMDMWRLSLNIDTSYLTNQDRIKPIASLIQNKVADKIESFIKSFFYSNKVFNSSISVNKEIWLENIFIHFAIFSQRPLSQTP